MDTATFAHPNATPRTLRVAAALVEAGAPLSDISRRLYRTKPDAQLALFGRVLARLERLADGLVVASTMELADLVATGARSEHSEGIIDILAQSETAEVALLLKEKGAETRLSVRTKPGGVDATALCATWGGGGHARAAGASLPLPLGRGPGGRAARRGAPGEGRRAMTTGSARVDARVDGILVVDKPIGPTSHDVVALVRRLAGTRKIGHGGTLDPFASGVLPLYLGLGTRVVEFHLGARKAYRATVVFGGSSTTDDLEGEITPAEGAPPSRDAVASALAGVRGRARAAPARVLGPQGGWAPRLRPRPPGRDARAQAPHGDLPRAGPGRAGTTADPEHPIAVVDVACSAGTYIRALARDLGAAVGTAAYLGALRRTASGPFTIADARPLDEVRAAAAAERLVGLLLPAGCRPGGPARGDARRR